MLWTATTIIALLAQDAAARGQFMRFGCSQLVVERSDPLVNPGLNPSPHTHQIVGGNSFNISMDPKTLDPAASSTCTSCVFSEDFSNYWTAALYFKSPENGTYKRVGQTRDGAKDGGLIAYYMEPFSGTNMKATSFKPGFRMLAGDPSIRTKGKISGICHRCMGNGEGFAPCDSKDTSNFPTKMCPQGIRSTVIFPSCWDGKNLDSPDHMSHMAYSPGGTGLADDKCPTTHPIRVPQVMYEVFYDTRPYNKAEYFANGKQPFVFSFGDGTGHGQHADYLFGWKDDALQRGYDGMAKGTCGSNPSTCTALKRQTAAQAGACQKAQQVKEEVGTNVWINELPGSPAVTYA